MRFFFLSTEAPPPAAEAEADAGSKRLRTLLVAHYYVITLNEIVEQKMKEEMAKMAGGKGTSEFR